MQETKHATPDPSEAMVESISPNVDSGGRLKIFLGYAPGVGKSYAMLDESVRRKGRGQDIVVGWVETRNRPDNVELLQDLETIPTKHFEVGGKTVEELDLEAIQKRAPGMVLIDDLPHTNALGSKNARRWQDVVELLESKISVMTTLDIRNLESLNDKVAELTGVHVDETVPDQLLQRADEVELVDLTPRALMHRLERGAIYPPEELKERQLEWFTEGTLSALRELALREMAGTVDEEVEEYRKRERIERPWAAHDRIMICLSPTRPGLRLVRRGWRIAQRMHAEMVAVYVEDHSLGDKERLVLHDDFNLADRLGIPTETLRGNVAAALIEYARKNSVTHIVLGHSERTRMQEMVHGSIISALARELKTIDILVVASDSEA
ncbi:MAG: sensor histidine kinase KdpD [Fimbriimonas ginsengisoli]|uniref:Sensor histidine kinase KdpD n=1 Tax=Fimbriimonas ginsengisoli TaxID=1005039 RepID=A0A931LRR9_FIMGI|nr:sensor histidine kinase KdpD [Fimbriimonas ginsengisoli]